jgi:hypothetical protein
MNWNDAMKRHESGVYARVHRALPCAMGCIPVGEFSMSCIGTVYIMGFSVPVGSVYASKTLANIGTKRDAWTSG